MTSTSTNTQPTNSGDAPEATFADFGLRQEIVDALSEKGIDAPFPIQAMTLPLALAGDDVIGQAKTGTGKTLGFGLPLLNGVVGPGEEGFDDLDAPGAPQALVVVPTRELASQVSGDLTMASSKRPVRVLTVYGGRGYEPQVDALKKGIEVVVGTPGRLLDLAKSGSLNLKHARRVVLDEADEMLDLGFLPDVEAILRHTPAGRQTMLFSATMPGPVLSIARSYMTSPTHVRAHSPGDDSATVKAVKQFAYRAHSMDKIELLARILQADGRGLTIIFTQTKRTADKVSADLVQRGFAAAAIHGDLGQGQREQALRAFRNKKIDVLIATDVAARGIDIDDVTHVINYQCPDDEKSYVHRIGRTGRAGREGVAVTFVDWDSIHRWKLMDKALNLGLAEPVETYSTSPHVYEELGIPEGVKGVLPESERTREGLDAEKLEKLGGKDSRGSKSRGGRGGQGGRSGRSQGGRGRGRRTRDDGPATAQGPAEGSLAAEAEKKSGSRPKRRRRRTRNAGGKAPQGE